MPAVRRVPGADVLRLGDVRVVLDRDRVVVVEHDEVAQLLVRGQRGGLVADALLDVTVGDDRVDVVVERAAAGRRVRVEQAALPAGGHRHADRVRQPLAERPGGGLHPRGEPVLRVAGGAAAPGPVALDVVQGQPVPGQVQLQVEGQAGVPAGQHEPVPAQPLRVGGVVPEDPLEQQVGRGRQAHGRAGVTGPGLLDRVHRKHADQVNRSLVRGRPCQVRARCVAHREISAPLQARAGAG